MNKYTHPPGILKKAAVFLAAAGALICSSHAAITGQWDFDTDLSATLGQPLTYLDGDTENNTRFGTTTSFGITQIGGAEGRVMKFPKTQPEAGGYSVPAGASPNGGGFLVNQYTVIMDVLFPTASSDKLRALMQLDYTGNAEYFVSTDNGIGVDGGPFHGALTPDVWHRIAFGVDLSANPGVIDKYVDGVKVGTHTFQNALDNRFALNDPFYLFYDDTGETEEGYINSLQIRDEKLSDGLIATLGGPTADGILSGPPPNPYIASVSPSPETARILSRSTVGPQPEIKVVIEDGTATVVQNTIAVTLDNTPVTNPTISKSGTTTTVTFKPTAFLEPLSIHRVNVSFSDTDTPPNSLGTQWQFGVGDYLSFSDGSAAPIGSGGPRGFQVRTVQAPSDVIVNNNLTRAVQQLNGTLRDVGGNLVANNATPGPNGNGSYTVDTIDFEGDGTAFGNFQSDTLFPGIPGNEGTTTKFATEVIGYIELPAGPVRLGVSTSVDRVDANDDDGFVLFDGENSRDFFAPVLGVFANNVGGFSATFNNNEFNLVAPVAGIYPIRIVHWQTEHASSLEFYSVNQSTGEKILINDPNNPAAIKAYQSVSAPRANGPYVAEASPRPGASGVDAATPIVVLIDDGTTQLNPNSVQLTLNGEVATTTKNKTGSRTTVTFNPSPNRTIVTNVVTLVYGDGANNFTNEWQFTIVAGSGQQNVVKGQWDFENADLAATIGAPLEYFDGAGGDTQTKTQFGTTTSFGIPDIGGQPAKVMKVPGDLSNKIGYIMRHGISPNGGGSKVNKYSIIMDVLVDTAGPGAASLMQTDTLNNTSDGDIFWQGGNFGQGAGGYNGTGQFTAGEWHRVAWGVDLTTNPATITKYVDGVFQDNWHPADALDGRRGLLEYAVLFADGDQDERRVIYVNSIQVRDGKLDDAQFVYLGGPEADGIPATLPTINVAGQWDFNSGNLSATIGQPLEFFDGAGGDTETKTEFGTTTSFGIADVDGQPASVMKVPGDLSNKIGYIMRHGISPNGGGSKVNKYTMIMDVFVDTAGPGAASLMQTDTLNNTSDGDIFWQGGNFGQGAGGYNGTGQFTAGEWHRVAWAVDLTTTPATIAKFVDGIKQDDWHPSDALDGRRALLEYAVLFADGDQDERRVIYVNSVQVRGEKLTDAQLALLGAPSASGIPVALPESSVGGQWDFNNGNLAATIGAPLEYFDGVDGNTQTKTEFGTSTSLGIPDVGGQPANVMKVPGDLSNQIGYIMRHGISPNGGGSRVNKYTMIMDVLIDTAGPGAASLMQTDTLNNTSDGDIFWQGGNFGQGAGGYNGTGQFTAGEWHRVAWAVDLTTTPATITKYVDGIFQDDWHPSDALDGRRALLEYAVLFADGDQDERRVIYVNSAQVRDGVLSKAELEALGGVSAAGIPIVIGGGEPEPGPDAVLTIAHAANNSVQISWPQDLTGFTLEGATDLGNPQWTAVPGVANNSVTIPPSEPYRFYRLRK